MASSKSKLLIGSGKSPTKKLGASTSSAAQSPLLKGFKKRKGKGSEVTFKDAVPGFGMTGLTGEN